MPAGPRAPEPRRGRQPSRPSAAASCPRASPDPQPDARTRPGARPTPKDGNDPMPRPTITPHRDAPTTWARTARSGRGPQVVEIHRGDIAEIVVPSEIVVS